MSAKSSVSGSFALCVLLTTMTIASLIVTSSASAAPAPDLRVTSSHYLKTVPAGTYAKYFLTVSNAGDEFTSGSPEVRFSIPAGMEIVSVSDEIAESVLGEFGITAWNCNTAPDSQSTSCVDSEALGFPLPIYPESEACKDFYEENFGQGFGCAIVVKLKADPGATPGTLHPTTTVCGGGDTICPAVADTAPDDPIEVGPPPSFDFSSFDAKVQQEGGAPATQAGSRPFDDLTEFSFRSALGSSGEELSIEQLQDAKTELPPGFVGNSTALPTCTPAQLALFNGLTAGTNCPTESQVGVVTLQLNGLLAPPEEPVMVRFPIYNMQRVEGSSATPVGSPAVFAFNAIGTPVEVYAKLRTGSDYGVTILSKNAPQTLPLAHVSFDFWGVPADPGHDAERGECLGTLLPDSCPATAPPRPFLTLPTSCIGPVETTLEISSWQGSTATASSLSHDNSLPTPNPIGNDGCNAMDFSPSLEARPTTNVADSASGLDVDLHVPQHEGCDPGPPVRCEVAEAQLKDTMVTLPQGMTINPSSANGLGACSEAQFGYTETDPESTIHTTPDPASCPAVSKLGTLEIDTPLLDAPLKGAVYLAAPHQNPFGSLLALYLAVNDPATGIVVKLAGEVQADPQTGQLTAVFKQNPQQPFEDFKLHFFGGAGGSLRTPPACGTYSTTSSMTPWTAPDSGPPATPSDAWAIGQAPGGGSCPTSAAAQPNAPTMDAGTVSPIAGAFSPFVLNLRREDDTQGIASLSLKMPPGFTGRLVGIQACSDAALASAAQKSGREEEANPSCPTASALGTVTAGAGAGPAPYYAKGTAYLTGPYKGAPLGMAIVTPATAGPFDLGTIVVRVALQLDPATGQLTAVSDPIPQILQGIPLDIRSVRVNLDRSQFTRTGTSCDPFQIAGSVLSTQGNTASISNRYQLGECTALAFKPKLAIKLKGGTKRGAHPALTGLAQFPEGGANVAKASIALPKSEFLDQGHIGTVCTRVQFAEGDGNGSNCPAASIYGHATATSPLVDYALEGPVFLRSSEHELPDLVAALHGPASQPIAVDVAARIDSVKGGIRSTFEAVPDLPVTSFVLEMQGGAKGLLQNSTNICKGVHKATAEFDGQNGKTADLSPVLKNGKCAKAKRKHKRADRRHARAAHRGAVK